MGSILCDPEELAELVREGRIEALDRLTRCYGERLIAVARRVCRDEQAAEDAVQDALVGATTHLDSWRGDGKLISWLSRMVANACIRMRRGRKNDPKLHDVEFVPVDLSADPELAAARLELADTLNTALLSLAPRDRTIVLLSDVEGWKGPEIARQLDMTPGSVRTRLSRARAKLREELVKVVPPDALSAARR